MKIFLIVLAVVLISLIVRYFIKYKQFVKKSIEIWESNRIEILKEIQLIGDSQSQSFLGYKLDRTEKEENVIMIPSEIENKWRGKALFIDFPKKLHDGASENVVSINISNDSINYTQIGYTRFYCIKAPRVKLKNGKSQNLYSSTKFIQKSKRLKEIYHEFKGRKKYDALEISLSSPIRIFGNPQWLQSPKYIKCPKCEQKMKFIAQIPGHYLSDKADNIFGHGNIYIFSCAEHFETFKSVIDIT